MGSLALAALLAGCQTGTRSTEPDLDGDGLPDAVEIGGWNITIQTAVVACFSHEVLPPPTTRNATSNHVILDSDNDGVGDFLEFQLGGDPRDNDTDDDGLLDGDELELRSQTAYFEGSLLKLNRADSDGDCLSDHDEVVGFLISGIGLRPSDPTFHNTDHDGFTDPWEVHRSFTDPTDPDTDGDGAEDHFDVDPRRDVWLDWDLERILLKEAPTGSGTGADITLQWTAPATPPWTRPTPSPRFHVQVGQDAIIPANNTLGLFNADDRQGGTFIHLQLRAYEVDANGDTLAFIDLNPSPDDFGLKLRFNATSGKWSTTQADGSYGPETSANVVDTPQARLKFALAARPAPN